METITKYVCGYCHTEYLTEQQAQLCEESHIQIEELDDAVYVKNRDYPPHVIVRMANNHLIDFAFSVDLGEIPADDNEPAEPEEPQNDG